MLLSDFNLPSGRTVLRRTYNFSPWPEQPLPANFARAYCSRKTYNTKPVLSVDGKPALAEIAVLRLLESDGWEGRWVDSWHQRIWISFPDHESPLPTEALRLYNRICTAPTNGKRLGRSGNCWGGCWDIVAWRNGEFIFADSKGPGDSIQGSQMRWLEAAVSVGVPLSWFLVVDWDYDRLVTGTTKPNGRNVCMHHP